MLKKQTNVHRVTTTQRYDGLQCKQTKEQRAWTSTAASECFCLRCGIKHAWPRKLSELFGLHTMYTNVSISMLLPPKLFQTFGFNHRHKTWQTDNHGVIYYVLILHVHVWEYTSQLTVQPTKRVKMSSNVAAILLRKQTILWGCTKKNLLKQDMNLQSPALHASAPIVLIDNAVFLLH